WSKLEGSASAAKVGSVMPRSRKRSTLRASESSSTTRSARPNWFSSASRCESVTVTTGMLPDDRSKIRELADRTLTPLAVRGGARWSVRDSRRLLRVALLCGVDRACRGLCRRESVGAVEQFNAGLDLEAG